MEYVSNAPTRDPEVHDESASASGTGETTPDMRYLDLAHIAMARIGIFDLEFEFDRHVPPNHPHVCIRYKVGRSHRVHRHKQKESN